MSLLALQLIAKNKKTKAPFLDLGNCGLENYLPEELLECVWLEELNLGVFYESGNVFKESEKRAIPNKFWGRQLNMLEKLTKLKSLSLNKCQVFDIHPLEKLTGLQYLYLNNNQLSDIHPLEKLTGLQYLYLGDNQVSDIQPLEKLTGLQVLHLNNNQLSDIHPLEKLTGLQYLYLGDNQLSDIHPLEKLTGLQYLELRRNQLSNIQPLEKLTGLQTLHLSNNQLSDIHPLEKLTGLQYLDLRRNQLSDIHPLEKLTGLQYLDLGYNQLSDIQPLEKLTGLKRLYLWYNQLSDIQPLEKLTGLQILYLGGNQLSDIHPLEKLTDLHILHLGGNQLSDIQPLGKLTGLEKLHLGGNQLSDISVLSKLSTLKVLDLQYNKISDIKPLVRILNNFLEIELDEKVIWNLNNRIGLHQNPIINPPLQIIQKGSPAIMRYFANELEVKYEGKLLIVGEPEAGKTTLRNRLLIPNYKVPNDTKSTVGIEVEKWLINYPKSRSKKMNINIWDFGGQEIQYLTHQFFLTSDAFYVLLTSARKDLDNLDYWFNIIRLLGKNEQNKHSKLLVIANEVNMTPVTHFVEKDFKERYPDLDFELMTVNFATNTNKDGRFKSVRFKIEEGLAKLSSMGKQLPVKWRIVRGKLKQIKKHFISIDHYLEICSKVEIDTLSAYDLSGYLHVIGEVIHFQNDYKVEDFIILNPQWAVDAMYVILKDSSIQNGYFTQKQVYTIWQQKGYAKEECSRLLRLMAKDNFEVSYPLPTNATTYIAPQLLSEKSPEYEWINDHSLKFRYSYSFMPKGIITRFIVRLHEDIEYQNNKGLVWKNGVVLKDLYTNVRVQVRETKITETGLERKVIDIEVIGNKADRKRLLQKVCMTIEKIQSEVFSGLPFERLVPCICPDCINSENPTFYNYSDLVKRYERGKNVECAKELEEVKINEIFDEIINLNGDVMPFQKEANQRSSFKPTILQQKDINTLNDPFQSNQKAPEIFFSYAWGDDKEDGESREQIINELYKSLKSENYSVIRDKVDLGYKGSIVSFMKHIGKGDVVIVAISDKYLKSRYCMFELYEVYRNAKFEKEEFVKKVYPIRVERLSLDNLDTYKAYWKSIKDEKEQSVKQYIDNTGSEEFEILKTVQNINDKFGEMIMIIKDLNSKSKEILSKDNFAEIKNAIIAQTKA